MLDYTILIQGSHGEKDEQGVYEVYARDLSHAMDKAEEKFFKAAKGKEVAIGVCEDYWEYMMG